MTAVLPRVLVMGTGALGTFLAARLARADVPVTIAGTWPAGLAALDSGILVSDETGTWHTPIAAAHRDGRLPDADVVIVAVKAYQTSALADACVRALAADGAIVTLQNGWGNRETLARAAPARVAAGVTFAGLTLTGPGRVRGTAGRVIVEQQGAPAGAVARLVTAFRAAALPIEAVDDIEPHLWAKLAANCAINPLTALARVTNGALLQDARSRATLVSVAREVGAVAAARGVQLPRDPAQIALETAAATAQNRSSMLQDLDRGAPTEIDALCGAVAREGARLGVPTPRNEALWRDVLAASRPRASA